MLEKPGFCALDLSVPRRRGPALGVRCAAVTLTAVVLGGALAGCSARGAPGQAEISASAPVALADQAITIEVTGLSLYTHHGVTEAERDVGQRLVVDLRLDIGETDATVTDSIEDTVDYAEVCQLVALIAQQRSHKTLERLCSTIADRLLADYDLEGVWVKAAKPEPPIALSVDEVSVEVWREAE